MRPLPETETEIHTFLNAFEAGTLPKEEFTHAAHILTGACYVHQLGKTAAIDHMRICIRPFNESVGGKNTDTSGYHETITIFWIKILATLRDCNAALSRPAFAVLAVKSFKDRRDLFRDFYDFDLVASTEARREWHPPTQKPIDAANL